jgi:hypothetical protein
MTPNLTIAVRANGALTHWRYAFHPKINLFGRRQDNWHCRGYEWTPHGVGLCRKDP